MDGNCMFSAFARGMRQQGGHSGLRARAVQWMRAHPGDFSQFVPQTGHTTQQQAYESFLEDMSKEGAWWDSLVLQALCKITMVQVFVLNETESGRAWIDLGQDRGEGQTVFWLYLHNGHYENLLAESQVSF